MKRFFIGLFFVGIAHFMSYAQAPDWQVTNNSLSENMTLIGILQVDGVLLTDTADMVGAFVGDEVRGVASPSVLGASGHMLFYLIIQGNLEPDVVTFKIYDASSNTITDAVTTVVFVSDSQIGSAEDPFITTENYLPTDITLSGEGILENQLTGALVGTLTTSDEDVDDVHTYELLSGAGDNANFTITGDQLYAAVSFDYETKSSYVAVIRTTDSKGASFTKEIQVTVLDGNDAPYDIVLETASFDENQDAGTFVSIIRALDDDSTDVYTYTLTGDGSDDDRFIIEGDQLITNAVFDAEATPTVAVSVLANEVDGDFSIQKLLILTLMSVNDAPILRDTTFFVFEDAAISSTVGRIVAFDQDRDQTLSYEIMFNSPDQELNFPFRLDRLTGVLTLVQPLNFETNSVYVFNVRVTDDGEGNLSSVGKITVRLEDVIKTVLPANNYVSPNNDGKNDVFFIRNVSLYQDYRLLILDQYGSVVLDQTGYQNDWDGSDSSGRELATGVYYYSLTATGAPIAFKGSITLFRE